ncbi:MAG: protein jag [Clostridiaceae bacterium]|nr:protein jag [Clostridiaceae bacterium]
MKYVEKTGKSVDEAVNAALAELNAKLEDVVIDVIEEANKGIFSIFGVREAKVRVTLKERESVRAIREFLQGLLSRMGLDPALDISYDDEDKKITVLVSGENMGALIGRRGDTLDAVQYLTSIIANKYEDEYIRVIIDTENYRQKREKALVAFAFKQAAKVVKYKKNIMLEPMNPHERKIIHSALQNHDYVTTYSLGQDPNRKVVIALKDRKDQRRRKPYSKRER